MPLLYTVISRGNTVLCKFADCVGNFSEVTENLISKIQMTNHKMTYTHGKYLFHYVCADKIIYMCISDDEFPRQRAFLYLSEIKQKFLATYGLTAATALPYAMNTDFSRIMSAEMKKCNESGDYDSIQRVHGQIDELKDIMVKNIENITARGERLELLVNKSENLRNNVRLILSHSLHSCAYNSLLLYCRPFHSDRRAEASRGHSSGGMSGCTSY
jgi:vesicle-associated membrane protein 7